MSEEETVATRNIWKSSSDNDDYWDEKNQIETQKELNFLCFKFDLEAIKSKGFQNPKFVIYLFLVLLLTNAILITCIYGYGTNWDLIAYFPIFFGIFIASFGLFYQFNQSHMKQIQIMVLLIIIFFGCTSCYISIIYGVIKNTPFENKVLEFVVLFPITFIGCLICCIYGKYTNSTSQNNNNNIQEIIITKTSRNVRKIHNSDNLFKVRNENIQNIRDSNQNANFGGSVNEWKIYRERVWAAFVLTIMCTDVMSDVYYGYVLFSTYGAFSALLKVFGITLIVCCVADLMLLNYMLIFPGSVNHFAHAIAFIMEIPNFVLAGISIWKLRYLMYYEQIDIYEVQQLAIFSIVLTSLNALIHIMYIIDSWVVQSAIELMQTQQ